MSIPAIVVDGLFGGTHWLLTGGFGSSSSPPPTPPTLYGVLLDSPAEVISALLIALGLGTDPLTQQAWPMFSTNEPSSPDQCITVYDTAGIDDGRTFEGDRTIHHGVQVRVRSNVHGPNGGYAKSQTIAVALDASVYYTAISVGVNNYIVYSVARTSDVLAIGKQTPVSKRSIFTFNALVTMRRIVTTPPPGLGYALFDYGLQDTVDAGVIPLSSGKFLVANYADDGVSNYFMATSRWSSVGVLDPTYATGGKKVFAHLPGSSLENITCIALQDDGKVLLGGVETNSTPFSPMIVVRLMADEVTLDTSGWGTAGVAVANFNSSLAFPGAMLIQGDGLVVAAGIAYSADESTYAAAIARWTTAGVLDSGFGTGGQFSLIDPGSLGLGEEFFGIVQQPSDHKLVATGTTYGDSGTQGIVCRLTTAGALDGTFGIGGILQFNDPSFPSSCGLWTSTIQQSGKIVAAGGTNTDLMTGTAATLLLIRLTTAGTLDASFGSSGVTRVASVGGVTPIRGESIIVQQSTGKLVVMCGNKHDGEPFVVMRFSVDGILDTTFGVSGAFSIVFPGNRIYAQQQSDVIVLADDSIVISGNYAVASNSARGFLMKLTPDGALDTTFGDV